MVKSDEIEYVCPLCCEELDISDREFYPCKCGYQVCMWCWHRIRESETGLCPACRTPYGEDPHQFSAVDVEEVLKANKEKEAAAKREKHHQQAVKDNDLAQTTGSDSSNGLAMEVPKDRSQLANMRVIRRNLIYAVGLPPAIATEEILRKPEYFGQYGKIAKIVINRTNATAASAAEARRASASAYVTFQHKEDTLACILALDGFYLENRNIRASYGTSKYCSAFIKNVRCNNPECTYLHEMGAAEDTFTKQEIQAGYVTSGRDVLARQQQILAEQLRLQQLAAGGTGNATQTLPRKRVGGGGPSGTGRAATHPIFPPPEYDEPTKASPPTGPSITGTSRSAAAPTVATVAGCLNAASIPAKMGRSSSVGTVPRTTTVASVATVTAASVAANSQRKVSTSGLPGTTTAASVVAAGRKETSDNHSHHSTLTALTPLKRTAITKAGSTGSTKATAAPRSSSSSPSRSSSADEKMPAIPLLRNGKKQEGSHALSESGSQESASALLSDAFSKSPLGIGGEVIGPMSVNPGGVSSGVVGIGHLGTHADPVLDEPLPGIHTASTGVGSLGGFPFEMPKASSLSSTIGGEVFNGPLSNDYHHKSAIGTGHDKWNSSNSVGGTPLTQIVDNSCNGPNVGGTTIGNTNSLWQGHSPTPGNSGVIGGQRLGGVGNMTGGNSTSALASILGINLPTGSGSLQETSSLWSSSQQQSPGPSPISALNNNSINLSRSPANLLVPGGSSHINNSVSNSTSLIGGVPIGGGLTGGYRGSGVVGGGNNKSDIALLQSLLPGVHITTDSNNPMMGFGYNSGSWALAPGRSQHGLGSVNDDIGGDPIHTSGSWAGSGMSLSGHHGSSVGTVGQHTNPQNQRQPGPGIW